MEIEIEYMPPRAAKIQHANLDGTEVTVDCEVESYDSEQNVYWISYTDPQDRSCCIYDEARPDELTFTDTQ